MFWKIIISEKLSPLALKRAISGNPQAKYSANLVGISKNELYENNLTFE